MRLHPARHARRGVPRRVPVVEQLAQNYFDARLGLGLGAITTGPLLFALGPSRKFAEGIADGAMPNVSGATEYATFRKLEVYSAALESLVDDGEIDPKERALLEKLRVKLGIKPSDELALENDALAERSAGEA